MFTTCWKATSHKPQAKSFSRENQRHEGGMQSPMSNTTNETITVPDSSAVTSITSEYANTSTNPDVNAVTSVSPAKPKGKDSTPQQEGSGQSQPNTEGEQQSTHDPQVVSEHTPQSEERKGSGSEDQTPGEAPERKAWQFQVAASSFVERLRGALAKGTKRIKRSNTKQALSIRGVDINFHPQVQLGSKLFFAAQGVWVNGTKGALIGTYSHNKLTNTATYGIVAFQKRATGCFIMKHEKDQGEIQPVLPLEYLEPSTYDAVNRAHPEQTLITLISRRHADKLNTQIDLFNVILSGKRKRSKPAFFSALPPESKKKQKKSTFVPSEPSDSEATEDEVSSIRHQKMKLKSCTIL